MFTVPSCNSQNDNLAMDLCQDILTALSPIQGPKMLYAADVLDQPIQGPKMLYTADVSDQTSRHLETEGS